MSRRGRIDRCIKEQMAPRHWHRCLYQRWY